MTAKNFVVKNGLTVGNITLSASTGNIVTSNANLGNSVTANYYIGDGGLLSNISLSTVRNGNSNLSVSLNGNVTTSIAGVSNVFVVSNNTAILSGNIITNQLNTGLISGTPSQVYVAAFNGTDAYLSYNPAVLTSGGNVTIEAWVYPTTANIIGLFDGGPLQIGTIRNYPTNNFSVQGLDFVGANIAGAIVPNTWQHIAVTFSSSSINAYVNGTLIDTGSYGAGYSVGTAFNVGAINEGTDGYFTGSISNFRVTNKIVYTSNFVPPALLVTTQTANMVGNPSAGITGTEVSLLTIQNNPIVDNSTFAYSVTNNNVSVALQSASFSSQGSFIYNGNVWESTSITANGNVTANYYFGDGGYLTNVSGGGSSLTVSQYTTGSLSNIVGNVSNLLFDTTTGFNVTDLGSNTALITLGSTFKTWQVAGQTSLVAVGEDTVEFVDGNNIVITTNASATPQQIEFSLSDNITLTGNIVAGGDSNLGNSVTANFFIGDGNNLSNIQGANVSGIVANANYSSYSGVVTTNAQPNITSVGTLSNLTSTGNVNFTGASNVSLGVVSNVKVTGGTNGQYLQTDGTGNLSWVTGGGSGNGEVGGSNGQLQFNNAGNFDGSANLTWDEANAQLTTVNISATNYVGNGSQLSNITGANVIGQVANANYAIYAGTLANGTSNVNIDTADGNVTTSVGGVANVFVVSTTGVTAIYYNGDGGGLSNVAVANITGLGNIATLNLDGNSSNILYGNGVFALGASTSSISNGSSNVSIDTNGGVVSTSVGGNANVFVVTGNSANLIGNLTFSTINTGLTTNIANTLSLSPATYAASFNGTNSGLIVNSTPNSNFIFGTEDFTIECWVYVKEFNGFSQIVGSHIYGISADWILGIINNSPAFYSPYVPGGWTYSTDVLTLNTWTHLAFSVISGVGTFYLNGVAAGTATIGGSLNCTIPVSVGRDYSFTANVSFNGLMSNLRVVKGVGVYTTSFTPSTSQLTAIQAANTYGSPSAAVGFGETVLLTLQNSTIIDNSVYAYTFIDNNVAAGSLNGSLLFDGVAWTSTSFAGTFYGPALSASIVTGNAQPNINSLGTLTSLTIAGDQYFPGPGTGLVGGLAGPGYPVGVFDGAGSLLVPGRPLATGLDSFTLEAWINPKTTTLPYLIHGDTGSSIQVGYDSSNQFGLAQSNNNWLLTTTAIDAPKINVWSHIAVVREGIGTDQTKIYVNGVMVAQGTVATNFPDSGMYIGDQFIGDITNLRYVQGIAVYTSNFTPSTTPLTAIQDANVNGNPSAAIPVADGTGFLLQTPNNASYLTDSSYNNSVLSQTGPGVTVSSASGPGSYSGSLYFDGSNQLLTTPSYPGIALGRGQVDWTVEVFVNRDALTQDGLIIQNGGFGYSAPEYSLSIDVNGYVSALVSNSLWGNSAAAVGIGGPNAPSNFPLTIGTWYHLALVRTGSTFSLYIDGTLIASGFIPFEMGDDNYLLQIGAVQPSPYNGGAGFKGYISNIRITRGIALYISTFTPPTAPLQLIQNVDENGSPSASIPTMTGAYTTVLTLQDPTFVDNSEYKFPIIKYGNASIDYVPAPFTTQPITFTYTGNGWYTNGNLAANGNISGNYIYGNGYYLTGISGGGGSNIANGTSNVNIDTAGGNVTTSVGGTANVFVVSTTGVTATYYNGDGNGISNIQGSNISGEVANANYATYAGTAYSIDAANVVGLGNVALANFDGSSSNVLYGNGVFAPGGGGGGNGTAIVNGTSNVIVELDSNVSTSVAGNANIFVVTGTGANINGNLTVTNISNLGNVGNVKITGGANGQILQTDGTGNLNWYNKPSGGTGFIYVYTRSSGAVEVQLTNSVLNIVGRSGNIPVPIS